MLVVAVAVDVCVRSVDRPCDWRHKSLDHGIPDGHDVGTELDAFAVGCRIIDTVPVSGSDEFDTSKKHIVEVLVYAALLSLLASRELLDLVTKQADNEIVFPPERWAATFRSHAQLILHRLGEYLGYSPPPLLDRLIADAQKIHQERQILQEQLATAVQSTGGG